MQSEQTISTDSNSKPKKLRLLLAITLLFAIVFALAYATPAIERQLDAWKLIPRHEAITELYVTDLDAVPQSYTPGQTQNVAFTVHNQEGKTVVYHYTVSVTDTAGVTHELRNGIFQLSDGQVRHDIVPVVMDDYGTRAKVQVHLSQGTDINYWLGRK